MGKDKSKQKLQQVGDTARTAYQNLYSGPTALEGEMAPLSQDFMSSYKQARDRQMADYSNIMGGYADFAKNNKFTFERVGAPRPKELGEAFGYLREAAPGYREFARTGGYSPTDIQELRARGVGPIRSAYGNTMMELNRARALGGEGGSPNYIAAASRAQRELPGQMADAMTGVNAQLAEAIRSGKLAGLAGISGIGSTMGGLSSEEANRIMQAALANQGADIQTQGMRSNALLSALGGQASLYGTTPGMTSMFGNQVLNAYNTRAGMEQARNQFGLGLLDAQMRAYGSSQGTPWWQKALSVAGTAAPYVAMAMSSRTLKKDIKPIKGSIIKHFKELPIYTWKYKGDDTKHIGPMAEEFKKLFGVGDGKSLHLVDVMGVVLGAQKEALSHA